MKKIVIVTWALIQLFAMPNEAQNSPKSAATTKIKVYYFHPEERCPIDQSVEMNTRKVMESGFQQLVKDGTIDFRVINTDDKNNAKLVSGFDINAQALYIVKVMKGKGVKTDLTKFAFDFGLSNPMKFRKGLQDEIEKNLK